MKFCTRVAAATKKITSRNIKSQSVRSIAIKSTPIVYETVQHVDRFQEILKDFIICDSLVFSAQVFAVVFSLTTKNMYGDKLSFKTPISKNKHIQHGSQPCEVLLHSRDEEP